MGLQPRNRSRKRPVLFCGLEARFGTIAGAGWPATRSLGHEGVWVAYVEDHDAGLSNSCTFREDYVFTETMIFQCDVPRAVEEAGWNCGQLNAVPGQFESNIDLRAFERVSRDREAARFNGQHLFAHFSPDRDDLWTIKSFIVQSHVNHKAMVCIGGLGRQ